NNAGAGGYTVTVVSSVAGSCQTTGNVTINAPANAPTVTTTSTDPTCANPAAGSITITAPLGAEYTYSIDGTNFQVSPVFNNVGAGGYTVTVVSNVAGSCQTTSNVTINAPANAPTVTTTSTDPTCADPTAGSITVTAPIGSEYTYSIDGTNFQVSPTFANVGAGGYTVTVVSSVAGACQTTGNVTINAPANAPTVTTTSTDPTCADPTAGSITVTAPLEAEYTYSIDGTNFQLSPVFNNVGAGGYTVTVVSNVAGSCQTTGNVTINAPANAPTVTTTSTDPTCADPAAGSITVTAPLGAEYTYSIDGTNFQVSPVFNNVGAGGYTVTVVSSVAGSCQTTGNVTINAPANAPTVTTTSTDPTCADPTAGSISVTAPIGAEYTYSIDGTNFQSSPTFTNVGAGGYTVTVISSTPGSCQTTGNVTINAPAAAPTVTTTSTDPTCADPTAGSITVTAPLGAEYTYSIDGTNFQSSPTFTSVGAGGYTVTVISNVAGACQTTGNVTINAPANAPTVTTTSADPTCADPAAGSITVTAPLGAEYTYSIDGTNFQASPVFNNVGA